MSVTLTDEQVALLRMYLSRAHACAWKMVLEYERKTVSPRAEYDAFLAFDDANYARLPEAIRGECYEHHKNRLGDAFWKSEQRLRRPCQKCR